MKKKLFRVFFTLILLINNAVALEPDIFVQSTVNRASKLLAEDVKPNEDRISELALVPKGGKILKTISYAIPIAVFALLGWFAYNGDLASIKENGIYWFAGNFIGAALFCMLAGGHPIAILVAALASPITSLNPALAAGWFAGYAQMKVKEPTGEDLTEFLKLDSAKLFWTNRAGRILLVTALTNLGSMAGAWISMGLIAAGLYQRHRNVPFRRWTQFSTAP